MNENNFEIKTYFSMALDPIHVGTGGYRLGRVDNTIVREPCTNLPKIPGTSLSGVTRAYLAMQTTVVNGNHKRSCYRWDTGKKAEEGALFTYEAIPRATVFCFDVVYQNHSHYKINGKDITAFANNNANNIRSVKEAVEKGFSYLEYLGIGGMNSRGMGRMKVLNLGE